MIRVFPCGEFKAAFPVFASNPSVYSETAIQLAGNEAMHHITEPSRGMPMENCEDRKYALFLMTAHILVLNHKTDDDTAAGNTSAGGSVVKAVIGSVQIENTKPKRCYKVVIVTGYFHHFFSIEGFAIHY